MNATIIPFPRPASYEPWIDEAAMARHLGVSTRTLRRWRSLGMPSERMRGARRYKITQVEAWLLEREAS